MDPIHRSSIEPNKATGKIWVRICTPTDFLHECAVDALDKIDSTLAMRSATADLHPLDSDPRNLTLCYCYSGTTGECLQTITTLIDDGQPVSLLSLGFAPIDHQPSTTSPRTSGETFSRQWSTIGEQRFLIEVTKGGFPSAHENSVARTICQFAKRFQLPVWLLRIVSQAGPAAHPLESRKTVVDAAILLSDSPRSIARLEQLDQALQLLYDRQVHCRIHIYPDPHQDHVPSAAYVHKCFQHKERAITITTSERTRFVV